MSDRDFDESVKRTIDRAVTMGGEMMRRGAIAIIELEIARARMANDPKTMDALVHVIEQIEKLKV